MRLSKFGIEEKQTDVNIAVEALRDAFTCNDEQHFVFVSNDTDFFRLFETLNSLSHIHVGVIAPGLDKNRRPSVGMKERSEWVRSYFMPEELDQSQLPLKITGSVRGRLKQYIRKPMEWYGQRDLVVVHEKTRVFVRNRILEKPPMQTHNRLVRS